ncbi:enoyl-CoA hydratase-related protein [Prauserella flavalba]|uniref:1,4-dihydroxy-2-naphthoyl-CoA synthase n=1 Tax=Prauserella flavalba TaxID=1477506 RepID=A0A318LN04_9PSEU|nr:enoyl-CoA hydratase-related protein [Prauserella flavalba]PXY18424.1 1,4-dihydroxy-2-naphthoyl-CoA synthase [Prauserella flavalba]
MDYEDISYEVDGPAAVLTINRPDRMNAFRAKTTEELIHAFKRAWADKSVRGIVLTGAGDRAFCVGGDVKQRAETGDYGPTSNGLFEGTYLQRLIRDVPVPVIAAVNGIAIGGGHVLHVICDLSIAAEHATFAQSGPRVGSFDGGFGASYLARVVGEKRAREIWFLLDKYTAQDALNWGLVNKVVPKEELIPAAKEWVNTMADYSPTALRFLKKAFNADTEHQAGIALLSEVGLDTFANSDEAMEGARAFSEKRKPDFAQYL